MRTAREAERLEWLRRASDAITAIAPQFPGLKCVILFGSITQPGRFGPRSDIDVAVACDAVEQESAFWRALEEALRCDVDVRPLTGVIAETALRSGVHVYG
jgi:predicted nucleotidyltransferase